MNEEMYELLDDNLLQKTSVTIEGLKTSIKIENCGIMETYSIFPGVILAFIDFQNEDLSGVFTENYESSRFLAINHCIDGRYSYMLEDDKLVYFGRGDLCIVVSEVTKTISDFPLGYYKGLELFMDVDIANEHIRNYIPDFDLIDFYNKLKEDKGYFLVRSNEKIDHVIGELYDVDERICESYYKLKSLELLLFFSITKFSNNETFSLSKNQVEIIENVREDLINNLDSKITLDELSKKYGISKTSLKNCFKEVYGKPIFKWRKEYKLDYACKLLNQNEQNISEISRAVGYSSPSKFTQAFKDYVGYTPSEYKAKYVDNLL